MKLFYTNDIHIIRTIEHVRNLRICLALIYPVSSWKDEERILSD